MFKSKANRAHDVDNVNHNNVNNTKGNTGYSADTREQHNPRGGMFSTIKNDIIAMVGEFIGTTLFLLFALGAAQAVSRSTTFQSGARTVTDSTDDLTLRLLGWWYISAAFGLSLFAFSAIFYRFTGGIFNPSVGLALCICRVIGPVRFILTAIAQMLGGIVASALVYALTPGTLNVQSRLGRDTSRTRGVFIEMFATAALTLAVLMLAAEKSNLTPLAPLAFGMTLFAVMLFSIGFTGGAANTARSFGTDVVARSFPSYHWIYWLGPTLGALLAAGLYYVLKAVGYWRVNPNQDSTYSNQSNMANHGPGASGYDNPRVSDATYADRNGTGIGGDKRFGAGLNSNNNNTTTGGLGHNNGTHAGVGNNTVNTAGTGTMQSGNVHPTGAQAV